MFRRIGTMACAVFLIGAAPAHADPGILPGAQQGSGTSIDSLIRLGVIVFGVVAAIFISRCLSALGGRSVKQPPDGTFAFLVAGATLLTAPSLAYALEYEVADTTHRIAEHARDGIDFSSAIVVVSCILLLVCSLPPSRVNKREATPIE